MGSNADQTAAEVALKEGTLILDYGDSHRNCILEAFDNTIRYFDSTPSSTSQMIVIDGGSTYAESLIASLVQ